MVVIDCNKTHTYLGREVACLESLDHAGEHLGIGRNWAGPIPITWTNAESFPSWKREFDGGATRDSDTGKYDFEGFLNPLVLHEFAGYMHKHRQMPDGSLRGSDNWQAGMPKDVYMKSLARHFMDLWLLHRGYEVPRPENGEVPDLNETLCGLMFNIMGYMLQVIQDRP